MFSYDIKLNIKEVTFETKNVKIDKIVHFSQSNILLIRRILNYMPAMGSQKSTNTIRQAVWAKRFFFYYFLNKARSTHYGGLEPNL